MKIKSKFILIGILCLLASIKVGLGTPASVDESADSAKRIISSTEAGGADGDTFDQKQYFDWQIAICYHPMYMLVDEDRGVPIIGERVPPWGAATAEQYLERVKRNLASLEKDPKLTLNYEWAACALEDISVRFPDVMQRMQAAHQRGQLDFVGGEYSLAHTMTYGSEADWRQFELGLEVFQRLFGQRITVHAHQENQLYPQLPQVLRHFGYEYLVMPSFPWAVTITEGPFQMLGHESGTYLLKGDEFIRATAPDGTKLPAYFATNVRQTKPNDEYMKDLWSCPPLWIDFPDLEEYHNPNDLARPVLLGPALAERFKAAPPRASGKIQSYYSYTEGIWAEEHQRASKMAEEATVQAGNLLAMARLAGVPLDRQDKLNDLWRTVLKYQDHDATWIEVTDLRRKAIGQFQHVVAEDRKLMGEVAAALVQPDPSSIAVFNGLPRPRAALLEVGADEVPGGGAKLQKVGEKFVGFVDLPASGYRSFPLAKDSGGESKEVPMPEHLDTEFYRVQLSKEGLIDTLTTANGRKLVTGGEYLGGEIRGVISNRWVNNRTATCKFYDGDVCSVLERTATFGQAERGAIIGRGIPLRERYIFFKHQPVIKVELEFDFDGDEIGDFHLEETKLNVYYPTPGGDIRHDAPFGFEPVSEGEQLLALNWVQCGGLTYVNRGTPKHWVRNGVVANTLAWGGKKWSNRIHYSWWMKRCPKYDLRLYGRQKLEYFLIPSDSSNGVAATHEVEALTAPVFIAQGAGEKSWGSVKDDSLAVTSLFEKDGQVWLRGYQMPSAKKGRFRDWEIFNLPAKKMLKKGGNQ
jgi:hypothetical protein